MQAQTTDREITEALQALQDKAYSTGNRGGAVGIINGHDVTVSLIGGYRNSGAKRRPGCAWYVDGKRVAADNLRDAIKG